MQIVYTGPHSEGVTVAALGDGLVFQPGVPTECPDEVGERLLEQVDTWQAAPTKSAKTVKGS